MHHRIGRAAIDGIIDGRLDGQRIVAGVLLHLINAAAIVGRDRRQRHRGGGGQRGFGHILIPLVNQDAQYSPRPVISPVPSSTVSVPVPLAPVQKSNFGDDQHAVGRSRTPSLQSIL